MCRFESGLRYHLSFFPRLISSLKPLEIELFFNILSRAVYIDLYKSKFFYGTLYGTEPIYMIFMKVSTVKNATKHDTTERYRD